MRPLTLDRILENKNSLETTGPRKNLAGHMGRIRTMIDTDDPKESPETNKERRETAVDNMKAMIGPGAKRSGRSGFAIVKRRYG